ncbi:MAG: PDZ domain-containing protein [Pseudomonadota bacterium]
MSKRIAVLVLVWSTTVSDGHASSPTPSAPPEVSPVQIDDGERRLLQSLLARQIELNDAWQAIDRDAQELSNTVRSLLYHQPNAKTGARINDEGLVESVIPNSPAAQAGLVRGDRIVQINGIRAGSDPQSRAATQMAQQLLQPNTQVEFGVLRDEREFITSVATIDEQTLLALLRLQRAERVDLEAQRRESIDTRLRLEAYEHFESNHVAAWDGLLLMSNLVGLRVLLGDAPTVMVMAHHDRDHPLRAGDFLLSISNEHPADAAHAARLLYDCELTGWVSLEAERRGAHIRLEMPYPDAARVLSARE